VGDVYDIRRILDVVPHRYPFLLVDRVLEIEPRKRALGLKCVSINEPFFQGHFPGVPVMPGVLIIEALAQVAAVLVLHDMEDRDSKLMYFAGIDECRFRRTVTPGDVLSLEIEVIQLRSRAARMRGTARVGSEIAAEAILLSTMGER
jgi:3-hydroxyacyl-[acyl-carrier-protein] dehydratase